MGAQGAALVRVYLHTLGCPKNEADSRALRRSLAGTGVAFVDDPLEATHIIVNTCGFIQEAKEESIGAILDACASYPGKAILAVGCLVERYREELQAGIPEVKGWLGLLEGRDTPELLSLFTSDDACPSEVVVGEPVVEAALTPTGGAPRSFAYLKISDGCDEPCTFCAIPGIKGRYHSFSAEQIAREADTCLAEGARELVLVGQDTSLWSGADIGLTGLIDLLAADERVRRIRLMYLQPEHVTDGFLEYMAAQPKLCSYLDIPFQHANVEVLRRMGRWGEAGAYLDLIERARRLMPNVSLRSAFIVGFPGESEQQFEELLAFVEDAAFDYAGGFVYSPEEGTAAAELRPHVRKGVARDRLNRLNALLACCTEQKHQALVGSQVAVMIDSLDPDDVKEGVAAVGRTEGQAPEVDGVTYIEGRLPLGAEVGDIVMVSVTAAAGYDLVGTCDAS
jgi:ribosomal protein S12 methylthiotransferase